MGKTQIIKIENDWKDVKNVSRTTVNKSHSDTEATEAFKRKIMISEHSPIREIKFRWLWKDIMSWISVHFSRHKWECYISTQREDRTGINRSESPQGTLVNMDGSANSQQLIDTARKRLCYQSSKETREYMEDLKCEINKHEPDVAFVLVPNCIYRAGCPEFEECGFWSTFVKNNGLISVPNIEDRYEIYNNEFYKRIENE